MITPNLCDPATMADPRGTFARLREEAPIRRGPALDGSPAWYVTRAADVRAVLVDPRFVTDPRVVPGAHGMGAAILAALGVPEELTGYLTDTILEAGGADHTRLRKLVSRAFTAGRVAALRPRVQALTDELLDAVTGPVDLVEALTHPLPITVICELVGVPEADRPLWRQWSVARLGGEPERFAERLGAIVEHVRELIARRRVEPADDLVTALVEARDDGGRLTEDEMITLLLTLVSAGHPTVTALLGNAVVALLAAPEQRDLLRREPDRWPAAIHELLRLWTPVHVVNLRYATEDVELAGETVRAGETVQPMLVSANSDPREHADPERFDVTRRDGARGEGHLGFGHGIHYCLGAPLARLQAEVALRTLFTRFPDLALDGDPQWALLPGVMGLAGLRVRPAG